MITKSEFKELAKIHLGTDDIELRVRIFPFKYLLYNYEDVLTDLVKGLFYLHSGHIIKEGVGEDIFDFKLGDDMIAKPIFGGVGLPVAYVENIIFDKIVIGEADTYRGELIVWLATKK